MCMYVHMYVSMYVRIYICMYVINHHTHNFQADITRCLFQHLKQFKITHFQMQSKTMLVVIYLLNYLFEINFQISLKLLMMVSKLISFASNDTIPSFYLQIPLFTCIFTFIILSKYLPINNNFHNNCVIKYFYSSYLMQCFYMFFYFSNKISLTLYGNMLASLSHLSVKINFLIINSQKKPQKPSFLFLKNVS